MAKEVKEPKVKKKQDPKAVVVVDGVEHKFEDLDETQKTYFMHMQDLSRKIQTTRFNLDQLNVGMEKFKEMFVRSLQDEGENKQDANDSSN
tara:strand:+ start:827 stop:1099 length:273 start_codon:yes stop_codon:yes gene_type:complete